MTAFLSLPGNFDPLPFDKAGARNLAGRFAPLGPFEFLLRPLGILQDLPGKRSYRLHELPSAAAPMSRQTSQEPWHAHP